MGVAFCTGGTCPAGYGMRGKGMYGLWTPIGLMGERGTGLGSLGIWIRPLDTKPHITLTRHTQADLTKQNLTTSRTTLPFFSKPYPSEPDRIIPEPTLPCLALPQRGGPLLTKTWHK